MASYIFGMFLTLIGPKRENSLNLLSLITYTVEAMIHLLTLVVRLPDRRDAPDGGSRVYPGVKKKKNFFLNV